MAIVVKEFAECPVYFYETTPAAADPLLIDSYSAPD